MRRVPKIVDHVLLVVGHQVGAAVVFAPLHAHQLQVAGVRLAAGTSLHLHAHILVKALLQVYLAVEQLAILLHLLSAHLLVLHVLLLDDLLSMLLNDVHVLDFSPLQHASTPVLLHLTLEHAFVGIGILVLLQPLLLRDLCACFDLLRVQQQVICCHLRLFGLIGDLVVLKVAGVNFVLLCLLPLDVLLVPLLVSVKWIVKLILVRDVCVLGKVDILLCFQSLRILDQLRNASFHVGRLLVYLKVIVWRLSHWLHVVASVSHRRVLVRIDVG